MNPQPQAIDVGAIAAEIDAAVRALPARNTPNERKVRRRYSKRLADAPAAQMVELAHVLREAYGQRWLGLELLRYHRAGFASLGPQEVEALGQGIDSWSAVDTFARTIAGPAWLRGQVPDALIHRWAHSEDRWWRRAALVSTVALNVRSRGGTGDVPRTLAVCRLLVDDHDDMVVKAMSWALRELVTHDPDAVWAFLEETEGRLAARARREVRNKLTTGLKNPRGKRKHKGTADRARSTGGA
jgi:3-methyladenine DNA glycosylase AlkD